MEFTADSIENDKKLLPSLLNLISMLRIKCWYSPRYNEKKYGIKISIMCGNCGKEKKIDVDNFNTTYPDVITTFLLNKILNYVCILWIIETHEQLKHDLEKTYFGMDDRWSLV